MHAPLLQEVYSVCSERLLIGQLNYDLLSHWFVGLNIDDSAWDYSALSFNRQWFFDEAIAQFFLKQGATVGTRELVNGGHF
ncbi:transposase [Dyella sp. Tek66A03]|uniref:transposase n=1 Tax=Dyella sp. Tek66A03 TaxID=3458298 RepID=UPI00403E44A3